jgi:hypothetical protein
MGTNGAGKTSLLRAIWSGVHQIGGYSGFRVEYLTPEDVMRTASVDTSNESWRQPHYPCKVVATFADLWGDAGELLLGISIDAQGTVHPLEEGRQSAQALGQKNLAALWFDPANKKAIPLFAKIDATKPHGTDVPRQVAKPFERKQDILNLAASGESNVQDLAQWFQYNELRQLQEGRAPLIYAEVKQAVLSAIHAEDISYVVRDNALMVHHQGLGWRPFNQLSDGQIRIASIFCDLAMRCASLNSHLGEGSIALTPGLVTIDELDLHLHPKWQQQVVGDLRRVFPLIQFIATSHSPFLLQAAFEYGAVVEMPSGQQVAPTDPSIEDILESNMDVTLPQRGQRFQAMKATAQDYYALLEEASNATEDEKRLSKQRLDDALIPYTNDPAYAAFLEMHRAAAGV